MWRLEEHDVWAYHLDTELSLGLCVQHLSNETDVQTVKKDSSNEVQKIICEEKDNDRQVIKTKATH